MELAGGIVGIEYRPLIKRGDFGGLEYVVVQESEDLCGPEVIDFIRVLQTVRPEPVGFVASGDAPKRFESPSATVLTIVNRRLSVAPGPGGGRRTQLGSFSAGGQGAWLLDAQSHSAQASKLTPREASSMALVPRYF